MSCGCPLSVGIDVGSGAAPRRSMRSVSMIALMTKALPVWRWHNMQWQQWTNIGADVSRYRTAPQEQPPVIPPMERSIWAGRTCATGWHSGTAPPFSRCATKLRPIRAPCGSHSWKGDGMKLRALTVAAMLAAFATGAQAQGLAEHRIYVNFDDINGIVEVVDNPLPVLVGVSRNGTVKLSFQSMSASLASYTGTFTGPSALQVGFRVDSAAQANQEMNFREVQPQPGQQATFLNTGNFFNPGISIMDLFLAFNGPGLYTFQFTITGLTFDNHLVPMQMGMVVSVADTRIPTGAAVFWGPWSPTTHYDQGAVVTTGPLIQDPNFNTFPDPAQLDYWVSVLPDNVLNDP